MVWIVITVLCLIGKKERFMGVQMAAAMLLTLVAGNLILKNLIARDRPCWIDTQVALLLDNPKDYSFPSGHTMNGFAAAVAMFLNDRKQGIAALVLAALIAFSRMYNFVHFPTDIIGGFLVGTADAIVVYVLAMKWKKNANCKKNIKYIQK